MIKKASNEIVKSPVWQLEESFQIFIGNSIAKAPERKSIYLLTLMLIFVNTE